jgi:hypothetical protein
MTSIKISMPWEASDDNVSPVGALSVYKVHITNDEWSFQQLWTASYTSQTNILHWDEESEQLFVGLDNGEVHVYKVPGGEGYKKY